MSLVRIYLLPDGEIQSATQAATASALFVSNIFFWRQGEDYFAGPADLQPALHTWSLSVEEQFYLFWPLLLAALLFLQKRKQNRDFPVLIVGVVAITLTIAHNIDMVDAHRSSSGILSHTVASVGAGRGGRFSSSPRSSSKVLVQDRNKFETSGLLHNFADSVHVYGSHTISQVLRLSSQYWELHS